MNSKPDSWAPLLKVGFLQRDPSVERQDLHQVRHPAHRRLTGPTPVSLTSHPWTPLRLCLMKENAGTTEKTLNHSEQAGTLDLDWGRPLLPPPQPVGAREGPGLAIQMPALGQKAGLDGSVFRRGSPGETTGLSRALSEK